MSVNALTGTHTPKSVLFDNPPLLIARAMVVLVRRPVVVTVVLASMDTATVTTAEGKAALNDSSIATMSAAFICKMPLPVDESGQGPGEETSFVQASLS
jgi:hypothetical protein